jgi:hypothetical protein
MLALAALTKFAPLLLAPLLATHRPPGDPGGRSPLPLFILAFAATAAALLLWPAIDPGPGTVWDRTLGYQADRDSPFSIWGQVSWLEPLRLLLAGAVAALPLILAFRPRAKSVVQVAALGAALLIGAQLTASHWFYLYIVWFYPLLLVALAAAGSRTVSPPEPASGPARSSRPVPAR